MSEPDNPEILQSEAFFHYDDFFYSKARPECQGCYKLGQFTSSCALDVIRRLMTDDQDGGDVNSLDLHREAEVLAEIQPRFVEKISACPGPSLEDHDPTEVAQKLADLEVFSQEFREAAIANLLPIRERCGLDVDTEA